MTGSQNNTLLQSRAKNHINQLNGAVTERPLEKKTLGSRLSARPNLNDSPVRELPKNRKGLQDEWGAILAL